MKSDILIYEKALKLSHHTKGARYSTARNCQNKGFENSLKFPFIRFSFDDFLNLELFSFGSFFLGVSWFGGVAH